MEITTQRITTPEGVGGYIAHPAGQKSPAVVVQFEAFGLNSHFEDVCRRIAGEGYVALAPDYYWRLEKRTAPYSDLPAALGLLGSLKDDEAMSDAGSCIRYLKSQSFAEGDAIATLGFCMGGRLSVLIAESHPKDISAAVSFYGGGLAGENRRGAQTLNSMEEAAKLQCPVLLFYGGRDRFIQPEHVASFTGKLNELGKNFQHTVYPDSDHGFFCNERGSYNAEAAQDAWEKTKNFLEANLKRAKAGVR